MSGKNADIQGDITAELSKIREETIEKNKEIMPKEREEIIEWLDNVKFSHKFLGGVDEIVVWKKIAELDTLYSKALEAERVRYDTLLDRYQASAAHYIQQLKQEKATRSNESSEQ